MTNEQARELAEKVFQKDCDWDLLWSAFCDDNKNYTIEITQGPKAGFYEGDSWESAFLAAGVEITLACEDCPSRCVPELNCEWTYSGDGIGYRLTEGRKP